MQLPFHSYRPRTRKGAQSRLVNCYAIQSPPEGKGPLSVHGMAGIRSFASIAKSPQRAGIQSGGTLYCVAGNGFYSVAANSAVTSLGTVSGSGRVDIAKNTNQIAILIEPDLWVFEDGTLTRVADADFTSRGAKRMAVLDSYGGFIEPDSGRFFVCDLNNFKVYDSLDFATAEGNTDNLVSIESNSRQFVLFGEESIELWDNVGGSGFPFLRVSNGYIENGCGASYSTCSADNTVFWLDQDRIFRRLEGITPRRISNDGIEQRWQDYARVDDATSVTHVHDGHTFVSITFPSAGATWSFDINTQEWHERQSYGYDHWRAAWIVKAYNKTLVGDTQTGNIGEIHAGTHTEWGNPLVREATTSSVYEENREIQHDRLEIDLEVGHGSAEIMLDASNDGGVTFSALPNRSIGAQGKYTQRVHWDRMGRSTERAYRFRFSADLPFAIQAAHLDTR